MLTPLTLSADTKIKLSTILLRPTTSNILITKKVHSHKLKLNQRKLIFWWVRGDDYGSIPFIKMQTHWVTDRQTHRQTEFDPDITWAWLETDADVCLSLHNVHRKPRCFVSMFQSRRCIIQQYQSANKRRVVSCDMWWIGSCWNANIYSLNTFFKMTSTHHQHSCTILAKHNSVARNICWWEGVTSYTYHWTLVIITFTFNSVLCFKIWWVNNTSELNTGNSKL